MTKCLKQLAKTIIDEAREIGLQATGTDADNVFCAEAILHMRDAQSAVNRAKDALARSMALQKGKAPEAAELFDSDEDAA